MDTTAQNTPQQKNAASATNVGSMAKEGLQTASLEIQPQKEVLDAGMRVLQDNIPVPPDLKRMGVSQSGPTASLTPMTPAPAIALPITDPQIVAGLHMQIYSAIRWLAEWCIRKLKKAHMTLRVIHGKVTRVPYRL